MKHGYHGNVLLVELIVVILFFSIAAVLSIGVFVSARQIQSETASVGEMELQIQNWSSLLYDREDAEIYLKELGFTPDNTCYVLSQNGVSWKAVVAREEKPAGIIITTTFSGTDVHKSEASYTTSVYFAKGV